MTRSHRLWMLVCIAFLLATFLALAVPAWPAGGRTLVFADPVSQPSSAASGAAVAVQCPGSQPPPITDFTVYQAPQGQRACAAHALSRPGLWQLHCACDRPQRRSLTR